MKIWEKFKEEELSDFEKKMGFGKDTIKSIGVKEFIKINGWEKESDVSKWRTDKVQVMPCSHCKNAFTTFQIDYGLCDKCKEYYDLKSFLDLISRAAENPETIGAASEMQTAFAFIDEYRKVFLKTDYMGMILAINKEGLNATNALGFMYNLFIYENKDDFYKNYKKFKAKCSEEVISKLGPAIDEAFKKDMFSKPMLISKLVSECLQKT